jgi:hypothetical protein
MRIAIFTNTSKEIYDMASITMPNKLEYCLRHNYSLIINDQPYEDIMVKMNTLIPLLSNYDILWYMDADTIITDMSKRIEDLDCLGPHITVCEEGIVSWNHINCGSIIFRNTNDSKAILQAITDNEKDWKPLVCQWQTWLYAIKDNIGDILTIAPLRSFNSCVWNRPGNGPGLPGSHWKEGDFVCHPCGIFPYSPVRVEYIKETLKKVQR